MVISYEYRNLKNKRVTDDKSHIFVEVHCNLWERLIYLFTGKINFIFNTERLNGYDDPIIVAGKKMTYKPYKR